MIHTKCQALFFEKKKKKKNTRKIKMSSVAIVISTYMVKFDVNDFYQSPSGSIALDKALFH